MNNDTILDRETIVAVFDSIGDADAAVRDLEAAGVPSNDISRHHGSDMGTASHTVTGSTERQSDRGFWATIFGTDEPTHDDRDVYERSVQGGGVVVSVTVTEGHAHRVADILERHNPIDIDERAASYGFARENAATAASGIGTSGMGTTGTVGTTAGLGTAGGATTARAGQGATEEVIPLAEERLNVGKRLVNRGTTRVRRFVVETPVEENVSLRTETVAIDRRPVTGEGRLGEGAFTDRVVEVAETAEEAVIGKTAQVREEVVIRKQATERTETVRDTVRREDVEIDRGTADAAASTTGTTTGTTSDTAARTKP